MIMPIVTAATLFSHRRNGAKNTISLNAHALIKSWEDFENYPWPDARNADYSRLEKIKPYLPEKMKLMTAGPCGLLENVISIVGYENLCFMLYDDPALVKAIFDRIGGILLDYYEHCAQYDSVGILMINGDWGFNTQTMLSVPICAGMSSPGTRKWWRRRIKLESLRCCTPADYMVDIMGRRHRRDEI